MTIFIFTVFVSFLGGETIFVLHRSIPQTFQWQTFERDSKALEENDRWKTRFLLSFLIFLPLSLSVARWRYLLLSCYSAGRKIFESAGKGVSINVWNIFTNYLSLCLSPISQSVKMSLWLLERYALSFLTLCSSPLHLSVFPRALTHIDAFDILLILLSLFRFGTPIYKLYFLHASLLTLSPSILPFHLHRSSVCEGIKLSLRAAGTRRFKKNKTKK